MESAASAATTACRLVGAEAATKKFEIIKAKLGNKVEVSCTEVQELLTFRWLLTSAQATELVTIMNSKASAQLAASSGQSSRPSGSGEVQKKKVVSAKVQVSALFKKASST